jgi:hypothetical protein
MAITNRNKIIRLKKELKKAIYDFEHMPRRESFSGLHMAGKIDSIQKKLEKLNADWEPYIAEISIEI